jgi:Uma2 family endonuclease
MGVETATTKRATLQDLARYKDKAELIGGKIVPLMPTGHQRNRIAFLIAISLENFSQALGRGLAYTDNMGFAVPQLASGRESFSPDASFFDGPPPPDEMDFILGPPTFAVEVRSKSDYGKAAEAAMAQKRSDYFGAGTLVVWDVDPVNRIVRVNRASVPEQPVTFTIGHEADAEPAVPGWRLAVAEIFPR